jgi:hypothetical protein
MKNELNTLELELKGIVAPERYGLIYHNLDIIENTDFLLEAILFYKKNSYGSYESIKGILSTRSLTDEITSHINSKEIPFIFMPEPMSIEEKQKYMDHSVASPIQIVG